MAPDIMRPVFKIAQIALVGVCLAFKRDIAIGIAAHGQSHQPLDDISQIEEHKQHLALLRRVDALVVHQFITQVNTRMHEQHPQQVDCRESFER